MVIFTKKAQEKDTDEIVKILNDAKAFLKASGSPQWQSGYPNRDTIAEDITENNGYVLVVGDKIAAYAAVIVGREPNYARIDGAWENDIEQYATIHRICISSDFQGQGLAKIFMADLLSLNYANGIRNYRVDTYKLNEPMQRLAKANGYVYRGVVKVNDPIDPSRLAFELNLGSDIL